MKFILKEFFRGIKENISTLLSFIPLIGFSFIVLIITYIFMYNLDLYGEISKKEIGVDVFIKKGKNKDLLIKNIELLEGVEEVKYLSSKDILVEIAEDIGIERVDTTSISLDVPEILHITLKKGYTNNAFLKKFAEKLYLLEEVEEVWYGKEIIDSLNRMFSFGVYFFIIFFALIFVSLLLFMYKVFPEHTKHAEEIIPLLYLSGIPRMKIKMPLFILGFMTIVISSLFALAVFFVIKYMANRIMFLKISLPLLWMPVLLLFIIMFVSLAGISTSVDRKIDEI